MSGRLLLLGPPSLEVGGERYDLRSDRPTSLLLYLTARERWVGREELAFLYHPESTEAAARNNVRKLLHRLRQIPQLPQGSVITDGDRVRIDLATDRSDFLEAWERSDWIAALSSYRGPFLDGFTLRGAAGFSAWLDLERQDLARRWHHAAARHAEALEAGGSLEAAYALYRRLLEADSLDEEALQGELRLLDALGRSQQALDAYLAFCTHLQAELGVAPLDTTRTLAEAIRRDNASLRTVTVPSTAKRRGDLPVPSTPFVGRERELAALSQQLDRPDVRLLTLSGLGGIGKTRLALELARRRRDLYPDGVWLVSLAGIDDPARLPDAIAATLDLSLTTSVPTTERLRDHLGDRNTLLLLDNVEQLVAGTAFLCELLDSSPGVEIVATSRTPLALTCETLVALSGLAYPPSGQPADATAYDGITLFLDSARRTDASFLPNAVDLRDISAIVAQVDGMPLAIELAAGWVRSLEVSRLRRDLERDPDMLRSDLRDLPERQRSVVAILDYTLERLPESERDALSLLAVFAGSFTLEAAEAVAGIRLGQLFTLINRALLHRNPDGRYELHALVRQIARLRSEGESPERTHAQHFVAVAERWEAPLYGEGQLEALSAVQREWDNLLQAWSWASERGEAALLVRSYRTLLYSCHLRSLFAVERALIDAALTGLERHAADATPLRATLLGERADVLRRLGDLAAAQAAIDEAQRLGAALDDRPLQARLWLHRSRLQEASAEYQAALDSLGEFDPTDLGPGERATMQQSLGNLTYYLHGDLATAETHYLYGLELAEALGDLSRLGAALINLGSAAFDRGDHREAERRWRRAEDVTGRLGQRQRQAVVLNNLGHLATVRGDVGGAGERYRRSLQLRHEIGDDRGAAHTMANLAHLEHAQGDHHAAADRFESALALYRKLGDDSGIAYTQSGYARSLLELGQLQRAESITLDALRLADSIGDRTDILSSLTTLAMVRRQQGETETAFRLAAFVMREASGSHEGVRSHAASVVTRCQADLDDTRIETLASEGHQLDLSSLTARLLAHPQ